MNIMITNERISVYLNAHGCMSLDTKDYFVKHISHFSKDVVIVASAECQLCAVFLFKYES